MRRYLVCYYAEKNDECHDMEEIVKADDIEEAIKFFKMRIRVRKRITTVSELPDSYFK